MKGHAGVLIALIVLVASAIFLFSGFTFTASSTYTFSGSNSTLTIWDLTDPEGGSYTVYAEGSMNANDPNSTDLAQFFTNFTNSTSGEPINGTGVECNITFNVSGGWTTPDSMYFDPSSKLYEYNRTFNSRGSYDWNVTCDGSSQGYEKLNITDNITISNTPARIYSLDVTQCHEDTLCPFDFSLYCNDTDEIDRNNLAYGYEAGTDFPGFSMNNATGMVTVSVTNDTGCGLFYVGLLDKDPLGAGGTADKGFNVSAVNDKPVLGAVPTSSYQNSSLYYDINATDEENASGPFHFNITFLSCNRPFNEEHTNVTDCLTLFTINYTTGVINRTGVFGNYEVGNYTINFTVTDPGNNLTETSIPPWKWLANETGSRVETFIVYDINDRPVIDSVQNQFWTQNQSVTLVINASDIDNGTLVFNTTTLYRNLTVFYLNASLFPVTFNQTVYLDNGTSLGNATLNYTVVPSQVGNYTVNISVYDGRVNGTDWLLFNITVSNINDPPNISFSCRNYAVEGLAYVCNIGENTTDPDIFPPGVYNDSVNGTLTFEINFTNCSKVNQGDPDCDIFTIDNQTGMINYTNPLRKDAGNYTLNISVRDGGNLTDWKEFNLTVVADYQPNITTSPASPQTATQNQSFFLEVNATDLDNATSDNLTFRTETYYNGTLLNNTLFPIETNRTFWPPPDNVTIGMMNYTPVNNSQVGNYTVKIIVNDTWGREDYILVNFTVRNLNDPPVLNFSCPNSTNEDVSYVCNVGENTTDPDTQTPYNDTLTYNLTIISGFNFFDINSTTGILNFTPSNDSWTNSTYNLTYVLNISVTDSNASLDWEVFNLTIHAVNDPPVFNFTNTTAWENVSFFMNLSSTTSDEEGDEPLYYNLTFLNNCSKKNESDTNCSIFTINQTTGIINFTPVYNDIGNYTINVTVRDSGNTTNPHNATRWELVSFIINEFNQPPSIDNINPSQTAQTVIAENESVYIFFSVSDPNSDSLTCRWYKDGVLNRTFQPWELSGGSDGVFNYKSSFEDSGLNNGSHNFTLTVTDGVFQVRNWTIINVTNVNRPPYLYFAVPNQTWQMNSPNSNINISFHLRDPDNENNVADDDNNLTFTSTVPENIGVSIDPNTSIVTLSPDFKWYGIRYIVFFVNDSEYNATSNNVTLNVTYAETETEKISEKEVISTGGGTTIETRIASLTITVVSPVSISPNSENIVPVTFTNKGDVTLRDIVISAGTQEKNEFSVSFETEKISLLETNKNTTVDMTITTHELTKGSYEIKIVGAVGSPRFNQSTVIYLRNMASNQTKLEEKIQVVKDLFEENPECLDLTELIIEAEKELGKNNIQKAKELTETALENCRDLIRYKANMTQLITPGEGKTISIFEMVIALILVGFLTAFAYYVIGKRAEKKIRARRHEKEEVIIKT